MEARTIPRWLSTAVQDLELNGDWLVTMADLQKILTPTKYPARRIAAELTKRGWLRPLEVRGAYEFMPGSAAGPYPSGDAWLAFRASLRLGARGIHVGANSAAWLLGYAQRKPDRHILVATTENQVPRALRNVYTIHQTDPSPASKTIDKLPVPTAAELLAEVAQIAPRLELDSARGWLTRMFQDIGVDELARILKGRKASTIARAGYIANVCGAHSHAEAIAALGDIGAGPYFTGPHQTTGEFSTLWRVYDSGMVG